MRKYYALTALSLFAGLYIYTVYRSEQTVVNMLTLSFFIGAIVYLAEFWG